jgi:hypothetical protein
MKLRQLCRFTSRASTRASPPTPVRSTITVPPPQPLTRNHLLPPHLPLLQRACHHPSDPPPHSSLSSARGFTLCTPPSVPLRVAAISAIDCTAPHSLPYVLANGFVVPRSSRLRLLASGTPAASVVHGRRSGRGARQPDRPRRSRHSSDRGKPQTPPSIQPACIILRTTELLSSIPTLQKCLR